MENKIKDRGEKLKEVDVNQILQTKQEEEMARF